MTDIKIDYIIPTYYDSSIVKVGLDKLCKQTRRDALNIIIVNDCSPNTDCNYQDIIDEYSNRLSIRVVKTPYNSGPGMAMQFGVDAGTGDYYLIQDDDDCIASDDVIESYIKVIEEHKNQNNIATIMGNAALCNKDFSIINVFGNDNKPIVHGRLFYRKFMQSNDIRYIDSVSWWMDDYYINLLIILTMETLHSYVNLNLDKLCYLYRPGLKGSVTYGIGLYEKLFRGITLDVEIRRFLDNKCYTDNSIEIYRAINKELFDTMLKLILMQYKNNTIREREWNILLEFRKYLLGKIGDSNECKYNKDGEIFSNYTDYLLNTLLNAEISTNYLADNSNIDADTLEDMYYTYLSDSEETIFNCEYSRINDMILGGE